MDVYEKAKHVVERAYEDINIGDKAEISKTITNEDIVAFAELTGDVNPIHLDEEFAKKTFFKERIAHGMLTASFISTILGTQLPGTNTIYLSQNVKFKAPVKIGDTVRVIAEVVEKRDDKKIIKLHTTLVNQNGITVVEGEAVVMKMK
ncbi:MULTISPECIES: MaoC family dehydratase [Aneurinibacillus]|uniref:Enoyl-CoA hydratase n=1 Tax=Aneurinibacillus thermoaerophilus TaxID=143495 RepID=A0A1G7YQ23_ANETH|nr:MULTISPECIES: MaoC family dehydratase [Aneurinibacillus]AMA73789.1 3-hydroxybutyryl-CoA dehydratase [Aneurinibacillus sp. XH2]MED0676619.1 MaoC family dehydratase [Aneurinibacillus thermoaerophilus]MED0679394.1 MaoC family dehydratase [Aneurinibacillus thermoaerophilus]MED0738035.1 MaoC family dehydratase [Aneurinibacillus thermoaerophilus]MED0756456.1 MaoC family dehydratase [Aneurinibacillus thermoaerophilus]